MQGITELTFWGYQHHEKLQITQVPYRDVNLAPVELGEGRIQVVMSALAVVQPQWRAGRIRLIAVTNKNRVKAAPEVPTAREQGYPSLEIEGMAGLFGLRSTSEQLKEKIAADVLEVTADSRISERLETTISRCSTQLLFRVKAITPKSWWNSPCGAVLWQNHER